MQDHLPATPSFRPIDALIGSQGDRTNSVYTFLGYQEGPLDPLALSAITPSTQFGMTVRNPSPTQNSWVLDGGLIGAGYFVSVMVDDPLYNSITDWKAFNRVSGHTTRFGGNGSGLTQPDEIKFVKYILGAKSFRLDQVGDTTYLRIQAVADGETTPVVMVFKLA
ncbi:hypothetical protein [Larkinella arboricola]|nr:hypothetical protein [Larkinella arboricola]